MKPSIFMTPHYDLKQQEKENNGVLGAELGGSQTFLSYIWWGRVCFSNGIVGGWGVAGEAGGGVKIFVYHMKM